MYLYACFLSVAGPSRIRSLFPTLVLLALSMPLARRKKVVLTKDDASLSTAAATTPVYLILQTGEIFTDYE